MDYMMMEASNSESASASASVQAITFQEYLKPAEPISQTIYSSPTHVGYEETIPETVADDLRLGEVRTNTEINMDQLQVDFQNILYLQVKGVTVPTMMLTEPSSTTETESSSFSLGLSLEENFEGYHGLSEKECQDLKSIAFRMNSKGRLDKLVSVYVKERKSFMNVHFQKLWDEKLNRNDIKCLEWQVMEKKIMCWIRAAECSFRSIFPYEKRLSIQVFKDLGNATDELCFYLTVIDSATQLFDFAEAVSSCRQLPERLQMILLLYRRFSDLMPQIHSVFESQTAKPIQDRAACLLCKFAEVVKSTLVDFEDAVLHELSNNPIPGGTIHNLTKYVMNHTASVIAENRGILMDLITSRPSTSLGLLDCSELQSRTPLEAHLLWIITALQLNLDGKTKSYQDLSLSHLFMMNNVHYIVQQIGQSVVLREMIGNDHLRKLNENVEKSLSSYLSETWNDLVYLLRYEGLHSGWVFASGVSRSALKERLKKFNAMFQEILQTHVRWAVPDLELRTKLRQSILDQLIPSYRNFVDQFGKHLERGSCPGRYIMYPAEDLEARIRGLFEYHEFL